MAVDLNEEPVTLSIFEYDDGRLGFSDLPETLVPGLVTSFGKEAVAEAISPSKEELRYYRTLETSNRTQPHYLDLMKSGEFEQRVKALKEAGFEAKEVPYFMTAINRSDEAILGRTGGIYFVCRKGCHFCQYRDYPERTVSAEGLAERMIALQEAGADNIQFISPSAYTKSVVLAVFIAAKNGLKIPIVHNGEGEDSTIDLELLNGVVDVYLPDVKFILPETAERIGLSRHYPRRMKACISAMYKQVGGLRRRRSSEELLAVEGVLVRHLLMPGGVEEARLIFEFLNGIDNAFPLHVMGQYQPLNDAASYPGIDRHVTEEELQATIKAVRKFRMSHVYMS